jgi:oxygen-independent coproporphyrinogen III oxidase
MVAETDDISNAASTLGIYVSIPFCRAKCSFCNFASGVSSPVAIESYITKLCAEIDRAATTAASLGAQLPRQVDTLYFGGGTPSLLSPTQLERIFSALHRNFNISPAAEITLEAAPGQIAGEVLHAAQRLGVNRISLGVQSFVDRESVAVGRLHTERDCMREILRLQAAGVAELGVDLIAGLPYQTPASWQHSLEVATSIGLTHLSVYMLEVDEDSRLGREVIAGGRRFHAHATPAEDLSAELYEMACDDLPQHGFSQYEISNFTAGSANDAAHQSRHNRKYWKRAPYLGFGLDAHSMLLRDTGAVRFSNPDELRDYNPTNPASNPIQVGPLESFEETLFLGLRMNAGLAIADLRATAPRGLFTAVEEAAHELIHDGLMVEHHGYWQLTLRGRMVSNDVFANLLAGVAA